MLQHSQPTNGVPTHTFAPVPQEKIKRYLDIYRPDAVFLTRATYAASRLEAAFSLYLPPLYKVPPQHLTRVQLLHYVGQAAYVLGGCLAAEGHLPGVGESEYVALMHAERVTFRKVAMSFREFLPPSPVTELSMSSGGIRRSGNVLLSRFDFSIGGNACVGSGEAVLILD